MHWKMSSMLKSENCVNEPLKVFEMTPLPPALWVQFVIEGVGIFAEELYQITILQHPSMNMNISACNCIPEGNIFICHNLKNNSF